MTLSIQAEFKANQEEIKANYKEIKANYKEIKATYKEIEAAIAELRADIAKWAVALFVGSIVAMTSILGILITSILLTRA